MELDQLIKLYDQDQRIGLQDPRYRTEGSDRLVRQVPVTPGRLGFVSYSCLDERDVETVIQEQIERFTELGVDFEWKLYNHDTPADLIDRLRGRGFEIEEAEAILVLDLNQAQPELWRPVPFTVDEAGDPFQGGADTSQEIRYRQITDPAGIADVAVVEETVWETKMPWLHQHLGVYLLEHPEMVQVVVAYVDGLPASSAWTFFFPGSQFASLWGGATLKEQRGKGLYTALLSLRAQEANRRGCRFLTVDASSMSRPILEKYGFRLLDYSTPCKWQVKAH